MLGSIQLIFVFFQLIVHSVSVLLDDEVLARLKCGRQMLGPAMINLILIVNICIIDLFLPRQILAKIFVEVQFIDYVSTDTFVIFDPLQVERVLKFKVFFIFDVHLLMYYPHQWIVVPVT